jgi:hypothetical protein
MRTVLKVNRRSGLNDGSYRTILKRCSGTQLNRSQTFSGLSIRILETGEHRITEDGDLRILE